MASDTYKGPFPTYKCVISPQVDPTQATLVRDTWVERGMQTSPNPTGCANFDGILGPLFLEIANL